MTDLYMAVKSDRPGLLKVAASDNAYCSYGALQAGHCFTVRAIFCGAGKYVSLVQAALESKRLAGDRRGAFREAPLGSLPTKKSKTG